MDLYRYFHPHHNPRLRKEPLRLQELSELEQAASELKKAVKRAEIRCQPTGEVTSEPLTSTDDTSASQDLGGIRQDHFSQILIALDYVAESLSTLTKAHPGDDDVMLSRILKERENAPGWENWCSLLEQRLSLSQPAKLANQNSKD